MKLCFDLASGSGEFHFKIQSFGYVLPIERINLLLSANPYTFLFEVL